MCTRRPGSVIWQKRKQKSIHTVPLKRIPWNKFLMVHSDSEWPKFVFKFLSKLSSKTVPSEEYFLKKQQFEDVAKRKVQQSPYSTRLSGLALLSQIYLGKFRSEKYYLYPCWCRQPGLAMYLSSGPPCLLYSSSPPNRSIEPLSY